MTSRLDRTDVRLQTELGFLSKLTTLSDNDFSHFQRPDHYIRYIGELRLFLKDTCLVDQESLCVEPLESELAVQVEYDMDEQGTSFMCFPWIWSTYLTQRPGMA